MKGNRLRITLIALASICIPAVAALVGWAGSALATPSSQFNGETLARTFFECISIGVDKHSRHAPCGDHDTGHQTKGHGDDDDVAKQGDFRVKVEVRDPADVYVVRNTVPAGGYSGWHTHPGPSIVSVTAGTATVYDGADPSCAGVQYPAGTGFIDAGGDHVHMVRNEGTTTLETVAFQVVPQGASRRVDMPDPGFCPF